MMVRTVVRQYASDKIDDITDSMLQLGLAQNVTRASNLEGDWVSPELLGLDYKTYLFRMLDLQNATGCHATVEAR